MINIAKHLFVVILLMYLAVPLMAQNVKHIKLGELLKNEKLIVYNRTMEQQDAGIRVDEREGEGIVWLPGISFRNGEIEMELKGKDIPGQSFVGILFHGVDSVTYEAVYFRPFNFLNTDIVRRKRSLQYISHPDFPWDKLREEHPGKYENSITPAPQPERWIHIRLQVSEGDVNVYVNKSTTPSLRVGSLATHKGNKLGLWVGNNSAGEFKHLKITSQ